MGDDALPPIETESVADQIDPLLEKLSWSKADLGRFFGISRPQASRWAHGHAEAREAKNALFRYLQHAAEVEVKDVEAPIGMPPEKERSRHEKRQKRRLIAFGEKAHEAGVRGLVYARFRKPGQREDFSPRLLGPEEIKGIRKRLGWIQAEMAAFFGVTHSTPAKWEGPDPGLSPAAQAGMIALREWTFRPEADPDQIRGLWREGISAFMTKTVGWDPGVFFDD